jgi:hypothetical protein
MTTPSPLAAAMLAPRPLASIDRALSEVEVALAPCASRGGRGAAGSSALRDRLVTACRRLATVALGPLVAPGSHFLELLIDISA